MPSRSTRLTLATSIALALSAGTPLHAEAQEAGVTLTPQTGSAPGSVYAIPTEDGRKDAAPDDGSSSGRADGSSGAATTTAEPNAAPLRSDDNGNGTSSVVPGATARTTATKPSKRSGRPERHADREVARGRASTAAAPATPVASRPVADVRVADVGGATPSAVVVVVLAVGLALGLVVVGRRTTRRR